MELRYKLNVVRMPSFGVALAFVEMNSALWQKAHSPHKAKNSSSEPKDDEDIAERFGNACLKEAVTDDNGDAV